MEHLTLVIKLCSLFIRKIIINNQGWSHGQCIGTIFLSVTDTCGDLVAIKYDFVKVTDAGLIRLLYFFEEQRIIFRIPKIIVELKISLGHQTESLNNLKRDSLLSVAKNHF